jgi:Nif-specific regulatory protein
MAISCKNTNCKIVGVSLLYQISQVLNQSKDLLEISTPILELMGEYMGMLRGTLMILNRQTNQFFIEDAYGLSSEERARGRYTIGEGVTGQVIASGEPMVVPKIADEPQFLDRTRARSKLNKQDIAFICVPIKHNNEVLGAISVDRLYGYEYALEEDVKLLEAIARMIAESVHFHQAFYEQYQSLQAENERLLSQLVDQFEKPMNMIGSSRSMMEIFEMMNYVAKSSTTTLIIGESGVGKELVASGIHYNSDRAQKPFVRVNCGALPENLFESELFGHEKGAFTGAINRRKGRFEEANGGTIFLDEIGDMPMSMQVKLLRVLQEKEFERVGSNQPIKVDVRVITATNRDLNQLIKDGTFREDLFYRLNVFPIHVPPLRNRKTDIIPLADHFIHKYNTKIGRACKRITTPAIDMLMSYHWPGNVRELENIIERAVLLTKEGAIHSYHLPPSLQTAETSGTEIRGTLDEILNTVEVDLIKDALKSTGGNMGKAAQILGITERIMGLRVRKHKIDPKAYRRMAVPMKTVCSTRRNEHV